MRRSFHLVLLVAVLLLGACKADADVAVDMKPDGTGTLAVDVVLDASATRELATLGDWLRVGDLRRAGWTVKGPRKAANGGLHVAAHHGFDSAEEATDLLASLGPAFDDLRVRQDHGPLRTTTRVSGTVDLDAGIESFGDSRIAKLLGGLPLGFDRGAVERQAGLLLDTLVEIKLDVDIPGGHESVAASLGKSTPVDVEGQVWNPWVLWGAASVLTAVLAIVLFRRGRSRLGRSRLTRDAP